MNQTFYRESYSPESEHLSKKKKTKTGKPSGPWGDFARELTYSLGPAHVHIFTSLFSRLPKVADDKVMVSSSPVLFQPSASQSSYFAKK